MDNKKKIRKHAPTSSSSSDESSSSSTSSETHRKQKHKNARKQRDSSSSSEEEVVRKSHKHHKKSSSRKHSHSAKIRAKMLQANAKKAPRSMSPTSRAALKHHLRAKLAKKAKQIEEHDRHAKRSRSPTRRDKKERTPEHRIASPTTRIRVSVPNNRVQDRNRSAKDSPSTSRRHVREALDRDRGDMLVHQKERDKMRRMHEDDHYKYVSKTSERPTRVMPMSRGTPDNAHVHERIPIRDRLEKDYEYRRSISREHEEYSMMRSGGNARENINVDRSFDYRSDERRIGGHEYSQSRMYDERSHHRGPNWEENREPEVRGGRLYESNWEPSQHERKRIQPDEPTYKDRVWNEKPHEKWQKDKEGPEWNRNWKDSPQMAPNMPHPRRWPGPSQMSDSWSGNPRNPHPSHKNDSHSSGGSAQPPFKPRGAPYFGGFKRFPYKRFPNQYSKINFPSKRVLPSTPMSGGNQDMCKQSMNDNLSDSAMKDDQEVTHESGELLGEMDDEKIAPDTTFPHIEQQEECEGNLSDFSDADDGILNREEVRFL
jgi:hypothetical protein